MAITEHPAERFVRLLYEVCRTPLNASVAPLDPGDLENALADRLGIEDHAQLLDHEWTTAKMRALISDYDFSQLHPVPLQIIELPSSILPPGVPLSRKFPPNSAVLLT